MTLAVTGVVKHPHIVVTQSESRSFFAQSCNAVIDVVQKSLIQRTAAVGFGAVSLDDLVGFNIALRSKVPVTAVAQRGLKEDSQLDLFFICQQCFQLAE